MLLCVLGTQDDDNNNNNNNKKKKKNNHNNHNDNVNIDWNLYSPNSICMMIICPSHENKD